MRVLSACSTSEFQNQSKTEAETFHRKTLSVYSYIQGPKCICITYKFNPGKVTPARTQYTPYSILTRRSYKAGRLFMYSINDILTRVFRCSFFLSFLKVTISLPEKQSHSELRKQCMPYLGLKIVKTKMVKAQVKHTSGKL